MGELKKQLEHLIKKREKILDPTNLFETYRNKYKLLEGRAVIWTSLKNSNMREPKFVYIVKAYDSFVLVENRLVVPHKRDTTITRYGVNYACIHCCVDVIKLLEFEI